MKRFESNEVASLGKWKKLKEETVVSSVEETKEEMGKTKAEGDSLHDLSVPEPFRGDVRTLVEENMMVVSLLHLSFGGKNSVQNFTWSKG